jgi:molecular chaperone DnaK
VRDGKPSIIRTREGYNTVPSIVALNARGKLVVGHPAKGQMLTNPRQTVYGSKRLVGRAYDSEIVQEFKSYFHYEIVAGEGGEAAVQLGDRVYSLQQVAALGLREVRELAQNQLGQPISRAVITVPAYYNDNQRQAVREAGRLAGLYVERILNEPTAAALAYGYGRQLNQRVLVYDLGGGTFDASVLELHDNVYEVVSTGGDTFLGGIDFDGAIVGYLLEGFEKATGHPFQGDRVAMQRITDAAERAKCALSERSEIRVHVPFVTMIGNKPHDLDVVLHRDRLIELTSRLVERTLQTCADVLRAKGLTPADVDEVILVGGQSRSPLVHQKVAQFFGRTASKGVHPDEAVALGAALFAHSLGQVEGVVLIDVLPMTIGVGLPGGRFKPVLEHNTPLPASKRYEISTTRDRQEELEVVVFQGEGLMASENEYLGTLKLSGLPPLPRGEVHVTVTFEVSNESLLTVKAREASTGREVESVFTTRDTPEAIRARLGEPTPPPEGTGSAAASPPGPRDGESLSPEVAEAAVAAERNGLFGWIKRLFSR